MTRRDPGVRALRREHRTRRHLLGSDTTRIYVAQGLRAAAYGFGAVLLSTSLSDRGFSRWQVGLILGSILAGTALMSIFVGRFADRFGRRRTYAALYLLLALTGVSFALVSSPWILALTGLTGSLSTEVIESGPFTSLEQAMIASEAGTRTRTRNFGRYNAVAAACGSLGALGAGLAQLLQARPSVHGASPMLFLLFVPIALGGSGVALSLSDAAEPRAVLGPLGRLHQSKSVVQRLASLFALDSFAGGLTISVFVGYWLHTRFLASTAAIGTLFFLLGVFQTFSFLAATSLARRFGLLRTMVFSHLPSNLLVVAVAFAPNLKFAIAILVARASLSQMDVPTRQAYVMTLVSPDERTPAAAYTNSARYVTRPFGPPVASALSQVSLGLPFVVAGSIKVVYDLTLWGWFRRVPLPEELEAT
ncbi:MAG: MFS transporter [Acidimicrobiaceae bacterium]|nr:MFS transporter [Acidimicrobiaceae bacterium]